MTGAEIIATLAATPGSTAAEIGTSLARLKQMELRGEVVCMGARATGIRGRPPVEWKIPEDVEDVTAVPGKRLDDYDELVLPAAELQAGDFTRYNGFRRVERVVATGKTVRVYRYGCEQVWPDDKLHKNDEIRVRRYLP